MDAPETSSARRAALLLHGLSDQARNRVLARLNPSDTARLQALLAELKRLGVSQSLIRRLEHFELAQASSVPGSSKRTAEERVRGLTAALVAEALKACVAPTIAALLRAENWPWQEQVLDRMPEPRRAEVQRCLREIAEFPTPAVTALLCERLCQEVDRIQAAATQVAGQPAAASGHAHEARRLRFWRPMRWMR